MKHYALIGFPLGHSFSQAFFTEKFRREGRMDCVYENAPLDSIVKLPELLAEKSDLQGFNVTIPYKEAILPYLDTIDPAAAEIGAVNCVKILRGGDGFRLAGYNTDAYGFERSLLELTGPRRPDALILGTGGASKAVAHVLRKLRIAFRPVSRRGDGVSVLSYDALTPELIARTPLIINTTPLGTWPDTAALPALPYKALGREHLLHDLVYNPAETAFLRQGRLRGAAVKNGYAMLVAQAERSWEIWNKEE